MARTGENIYKRKDGRWEGRYITSYDGNGKAKYKYLYAKTYADVKSKLTKARNEASSVSITKKSNAADEFINKKYLLKLEDYQVVGLTEYEKRYNLIRLWKFKKIVFDKKENINEKLISVFASVSPFCKNLIYIIKGTKEFVEIYIGIKASQLGSANIAGEILHDSITGNFPGSKLETVAFNDISSIFHADSNGTDNIVYTNISPSERQAKDGFIQGLEKFIDTMRGLEYTCEIIASPVNEIAYDKRMNGLENLYTALSPYAKTVRSHGTNEGTTVTNGINESMSKTISDGISKAIGTTESYTHGNNSGFNIGGNMLLHFGSTKGTSEGWSSAANKTDTDTHSISQTDTFGKQSSTSQTKGETDSLTTEYHNKSIENLLQKLNKHISVMETGASYGMWEFSSFFISNDKKTAAIAASSLRSILMGENTGIEKSDFSIFTSLNSNTKVIAESLCYCEHPKFLIPSLSDNEGINPTANVVIPTSYISGKDIPLIFNFPRRSVPGVIVSETAEFGRNIYTTRNKNHRYIDIGCLYHMGQKEEERTMIDIDSLTSHCFVTGSTGSGKSNTIYTLIENVSCSDYDVPFLVIEPAKGEYRNQFRNVPGINLFTTNPQIDRMLKINPFIFNPEIHILEHLDRLVEIFNGCWEMYAAMPAILKDAMEQAYVSKGWDLLNSQYIGYGTPIYPTFSDVLNELPKIINNSNYSSDTKGDYIGALVTRVNSMTNGIYGQIFCDDFNIDDSVLFDEKTIIDLSRVGSSETKSLIMGIIILKLSEYRMANSTESNSKLKHLTILEEAHNILKNPKSLQSSTGNNVVAKSVEMIVNSIAEMRTYGEGFIIVDQSPTSVDIAAIKNTNTKIIMRLPEKEDCKLAGHAISLTENQVNELSKLETGIAVVMQNNWEQAVLSKIDKAENLYFDFGEKVPLNNICRLKSLVVTELIKQYIISDERNVELLLKHIENFDISQCKKIEFSYLIKNLCAVLDKQFDSVLLGRTLLKFIGCDNAFKVSEKHLTYATDSSGNYTDNFTKDSIYQWKESINNALCHYIDADDEYIEIACQYIIHSKKFENNTLDYRVLYKQLY